MVQFGAEQIGAVSSFRRRKRSETRRPIESWMQDPDMVQWTNLEVELYKQSCSVVRIGGFKLSDEGGPLWIFQQGCCCGRRIQLE
uniref:Uncharacterized protein n=2 Tax=Oryza TaxID=4527 RepID=A0A0E0N5E8_ORYRU